MATRIAAASDPESTAVLVLFDQDAFDGLRSELSLSLKVVLFGYPDIPSGRTITPRQLGRMYEAASLELEHQTDVWIVGRTPQTPERKRAARFAQSAASMARRRVLRDATEVAGGTITLSRWLDRPGGVARRVEMRHAQAWADSVLAAGPPKRVPITRPFSASELLVDPDTASLYLARLDDTTFFSIGGCPDVELVFWSASERLGRMGPGVVPALIQHLTHPNPFVRERVREALSRATQDDRILSRTGGEYLKFHDRSADSPARIAEAWWARFGHFWAPADTAR